MTMIESKESFFKYKELIEGLPIKFAVPSFIYNAGWADNVEILKETFKHIQLLFFEPFSSSPISHSELARLSEFQKEGVEFSVHLPAPTDLSAIDGKPEEVLIDTINRLEVLKPVGYVLHIEHEAEFKPSLITNRLNAILRETGIKPAMLAVENLDNGFEKVWSVAKGLSLKICLDVGHLIRDGENPVEHIRKYRGSISMAHIHSVNKKDHQPLSSIGAELLKEIISELGKEGEIPLVIENYSESDLMESLSYMEITFL